MAVSVRLLLLAAAAAGAAGDDAAPPAAAVAPLLHAPAWHDVTALLDAAEGLPGVSTAPADVADLRDAFTAYGNVLYVPFRLDCALPYAGTCGELVDAVAAHLEGSAGAADTASTPSGVKLLSAVWMQLAYSPDATTPGTVPKAVPGDDFLETGAAHTVQLAPRLGAAAVVRAEAAATGLVHVLTVAWGFEGERFVSSHRVQPQPPAADAPQTVAVASNGVQQQSQTQPQPAAADARHAAAAAAAAAHRGGWSRALRVASYNVWNVNPPRWLWRAGPERLRQYGLRMLHLGDVLAEAGLDIIAFQEVRYDSSLGGHDAPPVEGEAAGAAAAASRAGSKPAARYADALHTAGDWYNKTRAFATSPRFINRNANKWQAVVRSAGARSYGAGHPVEGPLLAAGAAEEHAPAPEGGGDADGAGGASDDVSDLIAHVPPPASGSSSSGGGGGGDAGGGLYAQPRRPADARRAPALLRALGATPHAQLTHLAALLPGWHYAHHPAQLYLDAASYGSEPSRDEEGPAIFSRHPIVAWDYALLSRDAHDPGDGHQRLCVHAVVDVSAAVHGGGAGGAGGSAGGGGPVLVDVYSVHLALSEAARNRTVLEVRAFMHASARGVLQLLAGDMNAEPHEPALRALVQGIQEAGSGAGGAAAVEGGSRAEEEAAAAAAAGAAETQGAPPSLPLEYTAPSSLTYAHRVGAPAAAQAGGGGGGHAPEASLSHRFQGSVATHPEASLPAAGEMAADSRPLWQQVAAVDLVRHPLTRAAAAAAVPPPAAAAAAGAVGAAAAAARPLHDVWASAHPVEPTPRDPDAGVRRHGFTFPSDDPVKRIDLLLAGTPDGLPVCSRAGGDGAGSRAAGRQPAHAGGGGSDAAAEAEAPPAGPRCLRVHRSYVIGQDPLPGTDGGEGRRLGMVSEWSPVYASDHRGLVAHVSLQGEGGE